MQVWAPDAAARAAFRRSVPTLRAYGDKWPEDRKTRGRELRPTTRQQYRMLVDTYIYPTFGDEPLDRISADDVNQWYALAPGKETIRAQTYSLLRTIFTSAASEPPHPLIPYNPAHIRGAGNTKRLHKVRLASQEELAAIVEELPDRYQLMALLAAWCAMRFGELTELRRGDIDLRTNRVNIRRGVVRVDGKFIVGPPNSDAGVRDVAIPPHLLPIVKAHLKNHVSRDRGAFAVSGCGRQRCPHGSLDALQGLLPGPEGRRPRGFAVARPPPHGSGARRADRRDPCGADGAPRSFDTRRGHALPARRCRPRCGDRPTALGPRATAGGPYHDACVNEPPALHAWVDESLHGAGGALAEGVYLLAATIADPERLRPHP